MPWVMVVCDIHEHGMDNTGFKHNIGGGKKEASYWLSTIIVHHPRQIMGRTSRQRFWNKVGNTTYYTLRLKNSRWTMCCQPLITELMPRRLTKLFLDSSESMNSSATTYSSRFTSRAASNIHSATCMGVLWQLLMRNPSKIQALVCV